MVLGACPSTPLRLLRHYIPRIDELAAPPLPPRRSPTRTEERAPRRPGPVVALLSNFWIQSPRHGLDRRRRLVLRSTGEVVHRRREQGRGGGAMARGEDGQQSAEKQRMGCVCAWNGRPVGGVVWDRRRVGEKKRYSMTSGPH
jgi:hypothetical protein